MDVVTFEKLAQGKLSGLINGYLQSAINETLAQSKLGNIDKVKSKINLEITVEPEREDHFTIRCTVKKDLLKVVCSMIAVQKGIELFIDEVNPEESPLQSNIINEIEGK